MTNRQDWIEFVEGNLETQPPHGVEIMAEFSDGQTAPVILNGGGVNFIEERPESIGQYADLKRWRYLRRP